MIISRSKYAAVTASPLLRRLAHGMLWSFLGAVVARGLTQLTMICVGRLLGRERFGELGMIQSTISVFEGFTGLTIGVTALKYVAEFRLTDPARAGRTLALLATMAGITSVGMAVCLVLIAPWLAESALSAAHLSGLLQIGALVLLASSLSMAQQHVLSGFEAFKTIAKINILAAVVMAPFLIGAAYYWSIEGVVWVLVGTAFVTWLCSHFAVHAEARRWGVPIAFAGMLREWRILWHYSLPWLLCSFMAAPVSWLCCALLANRPDGYAELGLYNAADRWFPVVAFLPLVLARPLFPVLAQQVAAKDHRNALRTLWFCIATNAATVLPLVLVGCIFSHAIMRLYGEAFVEGWSTLIVVLLTAGFSVVQTPVTQVLAATGRMWWALGIYLVWGGVFAFTTHLWIEWGALGLASARLLAVALFNLAGIVFVYLFLSRSRTLAPVIPGLAERVSGEQPITGADAPSAALGHAAEGTSR